MHFLAFLLGWWVYKPYSLFIKLILRLKGVTVGKRFYIQGTPRLKIRGRVRDIRIGDDVCVNGTLDLRNREQGKIVIGDACRLDDNCRFVAAHKATLTIGRHTWMGSNCIINAGVDVTIGSECIFSGTVYINSSDHKINGRNSIQAEGFIHKPIMIGHDVFCGGHVSILKGVTIGDGAVIGANAVVTKDVAPYTIVAGIPAKVIGHRDQKKKTRTGAKRTRQQRRTEKRMTNTRREVKR